MSSLSQTVCISIHKIVLRVCLPSILQMATAVLPGRDCVGGSNLSSYALSGGANAIGSC